MAHIEIQMDLKQETNMRIEIPEDVLTAIKAVVEWWGSTDPDDEDFVINHLPVLTDWLKGLGLLSPPDTEGPA